MGTYTAMDNLAAGDLVTEADMDAIRGNIEYLLDPNHERIYHNNASDYTTTSTSFVAVDSTNLKITMTTYGGPVLVTFSASGLHSASAYGHFDIAVDGTRIGDANTGGIWQTWINSASVAGFGFSVLATGLDAGSHTFELQWRTNTGTLSMHSETDKTPVILSAIEI